MKKLGGAWVLILSIAILAMGKMQAKDIDHLLPGTFKPITSLDEIAADNYYLIIGLASNQNFYMLTNRDYNGNKLLGERINLTESPLSLTQEKAYALWHIKPATDGNYIIQNAENEEYIFCEETTDIGLSKSERSEWTIQTCDEGFRVENAGNRQRYLGVSDYITYTVFGNYTQADSEYLLIYKLARKMADIPGEAIMPENGTAIGLYSAGQVASQELGTLPDANYLLSDGTLAADPHLGQWTCRQTEAGFTLQQADGQYLGYDFQPDAAPAEWQISNGYIATREDSPRYLVCTSQQIRLVASDAQQIPGTTACLSLPIAARPQRNLKSPYTLTLSGGWTADSLAALKWEDCRALDLTGIALPAQALPFQQQPANTIIYVSNDNASYVPTQWDFVVSSSGDTHVLLNQAQITDGTPLYCDRPIEVQAGQITYTRKAYTDGFWETLCLPFDCTLPENFSAEKLDQFDEQGSKLFFTQTGAVTANTPVIIRYTGEKDQETSTLLQVTNSDGTLLPTVNGNESANKNFIGTYTFKIFDSTQQRPAYLLNEDGDTFVRAAQGSTLSPFRAYITRNGVDKSLQVVHISPTAILPVHQPEEESASPCYRLDGTLQSPGIKKAGLQNLPPGIYIWKGHTFIQKR